MEADEQSTGFWMGGTLKTPGDATGEASHVELAALFDALLAENGSALFRLAGGFANTAADRDDLFQEIVLAIWRSLPKFRGESSARTYLFRIAHNRGIAHLVSRKSAPASESEGWWVSDPRPDPERQLEKEEQRERLQVAVRKLPFAYREVITLALEGLSYAEMAQVIGVSEANVGARLSRAKTELRALLEIKR